MKVLVTGGSGFIGTNLVSYLVYKIGWNVCNVDIAPPRNSQHAQYWKKVNILEKEQLAGVVSDYSPNFLVHLAARTDLDPPQTLESYSANMMGVENVISSIRETPSIKRVIFASSQLVCRIGYTPKNEYDYKPSTTYGESKVLTEKIIRRENLDVTWTILRPTSIWGPWFDKPYKDFFTKIAQNMYVHPGNFCVQKQWGFVGNTVHQIVKLLQASRAEIHRKTFYLADYQPTDLKVFADTVQSYLGTRQIITIPKNLLHSIAVLGDCFKFLGWHNPPLTSFRYKNIITDEVQDLSRLENIIGQLPYDYRKGIESTILWLVENEETFKPFKKSIRLDSNDLYSWY